MTAITDLRADLLAAAEGDVTVSLPGSVNITTTVSDLATALGVTRPVSLPPIVVLYQAKTNTDGVHVRSNPGVTFPIVGTMPIGTICDVHSTAPIPADGYTWLHIHAGSFIGWVAQTFLDKIIPGSKPPPSVLYQATSSGVPILHVRVSPSITAAVVGDLPTGTLVNVYNDPAVIDSAYTWRHVSALGFDGWASQQLLLPVSVGPAPPIPAAVKHKIGLHVLANGDAAVQFAAENRLQSVTIVGKPEFTHQFPGVPYKIYRAWPDQLAIPADPTAASAYGTQLVEDRWPLFSQTADDTYCQITNEQPPGQGHNAFWLAVMKAFEKRNRRAACFAYAVGNCEPEQWAAMTPALRYAAANGHISVLHAYCKAGTPAGQLSGPGQSQYYETRFIRLYNAVPSDCRPPLVISEFQGEFARGAFQGTDALISLCQQFEMATQGLSYLKSYNLWTVGDLGGWADGSLDGHGALSAIAQYIRS